MVKRGWRAFSIYAKWSKREGTHRPCVRERERGRDRDEVLGGGESMSADWGKGELPLANIANSVMSGHHLVRRALHPTTICTQQPKLLLRVPWFPPLPAQPGCPRACPLLRALPRHHLHASGGWALHTQLKQPAQRSAVNSLSSSPINLFLTVRPLHDCDFHHSYILEIFSLPLLLGQNPHLKLSLIFLQWCSSPNHYQ